MDGEAAFHFAAFYGYRFGVIRFADHMQEFTRDFIEQWGFKDVCAGISGCGLSYREVFGGFADRKKALDQFQERARAFIKSSGAEVIIPGEMPLSVLLAVNGVTRIDAVPVVDGIALTLMLTRMMVDLRTRFGMSHRRHGRSNAMPPRERLLEVAKAYGFDKTFAQPASPVGRKP